MAVDIQNGKIHSTQIVALQQRIAELEQQLDERTQVEQELRSQLELYTQILDTTPDMLLVKDTSSRIIYANRALREFYGMTMDQLRDLIDAPFVEPDYTQQYVRDDAQVVATGEPLHLSEMVMRHDGQSFPCETVKLPIFNPTGEVVRLLVCVRDVTERKQLEAELDHFFQLSLDMLCIAGVDGYFKRLNPIWSQTLGYTVEELLAEPYLSFVHPDDRERTQAAAAQLAAGNELVSFENRYRCKDGSYRWLEWTSSAVGEQQQVYAVAHDITERKQIEAQLRENEQRMTQFLEGLPIGVFVIDAAGKPFFANQIARQIQGRGVVTDTDVTTLAKAYNAYLVGTDEFYPAERMPLVRALQGERTTIDDMVIRHPDRDIPLEVVGAPILDQHGKVIYAMAAFMDITERRRAEQALRQTMLQEEIIRAQASALEELSTPFIPISDHAMVMPLIGSLDSRRAQQVIDTLLQGIAANHAQIAIVDITGVAVVDSQVANALIQAAQAVRLLGAQIMLTGIRPEVAQTLVGLGVDLSGIITRSSLQSGIAYALKRRSVS